MSKFPAPSRQISPVFLTLSAFLVLLFATGGASRVDVQSLVILRPVSIIVCALALMTIRSEHLVERKALFFLITAVFALALLHIIPLPPALWELLPGRRELVDVEKLAGLSNIWRPLTLTPMNGQHALLSLFVPLAVILLGIQLNRDELFRLLPLLITLAGVSGLLGMLQTLGDQHGILYFYRITNNGSAVGLFANRNHAATLLACMFPMLAVFASTSKGTADQVRLKRCLAAAIAVVLIPLILITGSRSGLVNALIGVVAAGLLYNPENAFKTSAKGVALRIKNGQIFFILIAIIIGFMTFFFSRAEAIERFFSDEANNDGRVDFWKVCLELFWKYFPWGSGSGSFVEVFQISEPSYLLNVTYINRAHNDWLETAVTFGLPGLIGLTLVFAAFSLRSYRLWRNTEAERRYGTFGRLSSVCMTLIGISSISDYPLRTPTMMGVFAVFVLWFTENEKGRSISMPSDRASN